MGFTALLLFLVSACVHTEPPPNGSWFISLALSTNVVCIGSLVKERVWESPGSRNGLYVNLCVAQLKGNCAGSFAQNQSAKVIVKTRGQPLKQRCLMAA